MNHDKLSYPFVIFYIFSLTVFMPGCYEYKWGSSEEEPSCETIEFKDGEFSYKITAIPPSPDLNSNHVSISWTLSVKGGNSSATVYRNFVSVLGMHTDGTCIYKDFAPINCNEFTKVSEILPKCYTDSGDFITDPIWFNNKELTIIGQYGRGGANSDGSTKFWQDTFTTTIKYDPIPIPRNLQSVTASVFSPAKGCTSDLTVIATIDNAIYVKKVQLFASPKLFDGAIEGQLIGEKQVNALPLDITDKITSNRYTWQSDVLGQCFFQIAVAQGRVSFGGDTSWSDFKYSTYTTLNNITCIAPNVNIPVITKKDGTTALNKIVMLKAEGPLEVSVCAKTDSTDYAKKIILTIAYDKTNIDQSNFYLTNFSSGIVRTIVQTFTSRPLDNIYKITWDGRDSSEAKRLILSGKYTLNATVTFFKGQTGSNSTSLEVAAPELFNITCNYPGTEDSVVVKFRKNYTDTFFVFDPRVSYLTEAIDKNFEWVRQFGNIGSTVSISQYKKNQNYGNSIVDSILTNLEKKGAIFSYVGHVAREPVSPYVPFLMFFSNHLYSKCGVNYYGTCNNGNICLDNNCSGTNRSDSTKLFMDDVLLAVLMGCKTDLRRGTDSSIVDQFLLHGVDCVIGTKVNKVMVQVMNFWYYRFYEELFKNKKTIARAAEGAYDKAIDDIRYLYPEIADTASFSDVQSYFKPYVEGGITYNSLETFRNTISIRDNPNNPINDTVSTLSVLPARHGACQKCK